MSDWNPDRIKNLRLKKGLSQDAFGKRLGVTRNFIYYLERGERTPSKTLQLLLDCVEKENEKGKEEKKRNVI
jgi:transcriptional regulator with XRE-family HTH domain